MKIFFVLISLLINFGFYIAPIVIFQYISRKKWKRQIFTIDLRKTSDIALVIGPYAIWFLFYLFDPIQKTVRQIIFVDTVIMGTFLLILLILRYHLGKKSNPARYTILATVLSWLSALVTWFIIPPSA